MQKLPDWFKVKPVKHPYTKCLA